MPYVDGYVLPVPRANIEAYREMARKSGEIWREHGALEYREFIADDVQPGQWTSFPQAVDLKDDEIVVFAYVVYSSRAQRDAINAKVEADPRMDAMRDPNAHPFDSKRMIFGGFTLLVDV